MAQTQLSLSEITAIIGAKIAEMDIAINQFPSDVYSKGARDCAVNILQAIRDAAAKTS
jgi:hypothetical protein